LKANAIHVRPFGYVKTLESCLSKKSAQKGYGCRD
jgi:hypothetical protein